MSHKRTDIRNALKAMLLGTGPAYATDAEDRVYTNRAYNIQSAKLPVILIHDESETATQRTNGPANYLRKLILKVECLVTASTDYDSDLDDLCKQVEDLISADRSISGTCSASLYQGTELKFDTGSKPIGQAILTYEITYLP
jgi:hypothetical protein